MTSIASMWLALALAQDKPRAESTWDRWTTVNQLELEPELIRPLTEPIDIEQGPATLRLEGGYLVPVFSGRFAGAWERDAKKILREQRAARLEPRLPGPEERGSRQLVGWVWTAGTGTLQAELSDRADALILGNRMVRELGAEPGAVAPLAHGEVPLSTSVTDALVLSVDPRLDAHFEGPEQLDPYEIVVTGTSREAERAAARAAEVFEARLRAWDAVRLQPGERIGWERLAIEQGVLSGAGGFTLIDTLTDQRYGLVAPQVGGAADRWLSVVYDREGRHDSRRSHRIASVGISPSGRGVNGLIGGIPHPPLDPDDPTSAPTPVVRIEPLTASSTVLVQASSNGLQLDVSVDSWLTVRAVGGPASRITLALPKRERRPGSFRLLRAELEDGTQLLGRPPVTEAPEPEPEPEPRPRPRPDPDPGPEPEPDPEQLPEPDDAIVQLLLPEPLQPGEVLQIRLTHEDSWPYANYVDSYLQTTSTGPSSGMQGFLPRLRPGVPGSPWSFSARVAVPAASKLVAAVGGATTAEEEDNGWRVVRASSGSVSARWPAIAVGRFVTHEAPATLGYPAVRVRMLSSHHGSIDSFAPEVRRVVQYYQRWLPAFPVEEVEIFEAPWAHNGFTWIAPHGMVAVQQMRTVGGASVRNRTPRLESSVFAHELAHQYWGHLAPPASVEDFWIAETMSEVYSCMYVGAAFAPEDCLGRMASARQLWEGREAPSTEASLSRAYTTTAQPHVVYRYGPILLAQGLQPLIGRQAFFAAFDVLLSEHPHEPLTTERLQAYLEAASGRDLGDWFDFWIHGGFLPDLDARWQQQGRTVTGTLTSGVPFGRFDVPVRVISKGGAVDALVTIVDGQGSFEIEAHDTKGIEVQIDPGGWLVARGRSARGAQKSKR